MEIKLLIIEDERSQIQVYKDSIEQYNKKNNIHFTYEIFEDFEDGQKALSTPFYDAAIIDLKLSNSVDLEGKKLVESIYQKIRIPVIIYSGSIAQIDDIHENALLKKRLRTEQFSDILSEIKTIYDTGITTFLKPEGKIDSQLTSIFWDHLSNDLDVWIKHNNPDTLLRYILSHFQEYLGINQHGNFEEYHPFEIYIKPPIKKNIHTGDIIKFRKELYLVLTPACDIIIQRYEKAENGIEIPIRKADNIVLAKVTEFDYKNLCQDKMGNLKKDKIKSYVTNQAYRYHYLPPFDDNDGLLVDFQDIISVLFNDDFERIASISSPFIKDIISRFSNYYSRQGQPTFNQDKIVDDLYNKK